MISNMAAAKKPASKQPVPGNNSKPSQKGTVIRMDAGGNSYFGSRTSPKPYVPNFNVPAGTPFKEGSPYKPKQPGKMGPGAQNPGTPRPVAPKKKPVSPAPKPSIASNAKPSMGPVGSMAASKTMPSKKAAPKKK
jgi:hypothetical protein